MSYIVLDLKNQILNSESMRLLQTLILLALAAPLHAADPDKKHSGNPVFEGNYADPEALVFGKEYWIYPTFSAGYDQQLHFDAFSSPDLVNWKKHSNILDNSEIKWAKRAMWAPSVTEKDGKYYFFFAANDVQKKSGIGGIGVAIAEKPSGPFKDLLGKPLLNENVNGAQPIDQYVFKDNGKYYMAYGGWGHCNLTQLNDDFTGFVPFADGSTFREITPEGYVEGPIFFRRKGKLYFMWSEGGWTGPDYSVAYAIADSLDGPFKRIGKILQQDPEIATGAGHHSVINVPGTDEWFIVYHRRPAGSNDANNRVTCIDRMEFNDDGTIKPVKITKEGVTAHPIK